MNRLDWNSYFLEISETVSSRSSCDRLKVGAVIVKDHRILTTGYNGSLPGTRHCEEVGHLMINDSCKLTVHAEMNAIAQAALNGVSINNSTIYISHSPCIDCFKMILASGINRIIFNNAYKLTPEQIEIYNKLSDYSWVLELDEREWYKI